MYLSVAKDSLLICCPFYPLAGQRCETPLDVVFVLDSSGSIRDQNLPGQPDNYDQTLNFLQVEYNIEHFNVRRKKQLLSIMFSMLKDTANLSVSATDVIVTRSSGKVKFAEFTSIILVQNNPFYRGVPLWV